MLYGYVRLRVFRGADCNTDHYLMSAKFKERLAASKHAAQDFDGERSNPRKLSELGIRKW
jgi:hypothetical protein